MGDLGECGNLEDSINLGDRNLGSGLGMRLGTLSKLENGECLLVDLK